MAEAASRLYVPALGGIYGAANAYAEPILRIGLGAVLIPHGMQKLFGAFGGMGLTNNAALFERLGVHIDPARPAEGLSIADPRGWTSAATPVSGSTPGAAPASGTTGHSAWVSATATSARRRPCSACRTGW